MSRATTLLVGAVFAAVAVALGAFGAHALDLSPEAAQTWRTASLYHIVHAVALVALAGLRLTWNKVMACCAWLLSLGIVAFAGSLYLLVLDGPRWLGPITPVGGLAFIAAWLLLASQARRLFTTA